jgi:deoxyribodipyrimidine photo-lyase
VDADLANNTMNWQWVAGCGADAAPFFRIFNPLGHTYPAPLVDLKRSREEALAAYQTMRRA